MKISIFGTGYVGLVTGVCFAEKGHHVLCADVDPAKIARLREGQSPIYEPGLDEILRTNIAAGRISFTTDLAAAVKASPTLFIAVGTPSDIDGSADLQYVLKVAKTFAENMTEAKTVVMKSTVPVGTNAKIRELLTTELQTLGKTHAFDVVSNPEFLREGWALEDSLRPARIVVGTNSPESARLMTELYAGFREQGQPLLLMDPVSAEMTKYAANAMLAARISLMNEFSRVCEKTGADIEKVRLGLGSDPRIGPQFLHAGIGYGGSCFPKDVKALIRIGAEHGETLSILESVTSVNAGQRDHFVAKVKKTLGSLEGKTIAVWGLAFKPHTDDVREAPAFDILRLLLSKGAKVRAFDPIAQENFHREFGDHAGLSYATTAAEAMKDADALCLLTEWPEFQRVDPAAIKSSLKSPYVFDGRNALIPDEMKAHGLNYHPMGRPPVRA